MTLKGNYRENYPRFKGFANIFAKFSPAKITTFTVMHLFIQTVTILCN